MKNKDEKLKNQPVSWSSIYTTVLVLDDGVQTHRVKEGGGIGSKHVCPRFLTVARPRIGFCFKKENVRILFNRVVQEAY